MAKLISFEKAIRKKGLKEGDEVIINALYPNESEVVKLYPDETGYKEEQLFSREEDLKFFYAKNKDSIHTFWGNATSVNLNLIGRIGVTFGITSINKACKPWTNLKMGLYSRAATFDDYIYLCNKLKKDHHLIKAYAYLGTQYVETYGIDYVQFGLRYVSNGHMNGYDLLYSTFGSYDDYNHVRPAVSVYQPSKIMVDMEKSKDGVWVLVPKSK